MDRFAAMLILLGLSLALILIFLSSLFHAPMTTSCLFVLLNVTYVMFAHQDSTVHAAQESENRFWTLFVVLLTSVLIFARDSPLAFGYRYSPAAGFVAAVFSGYLMHICDRHWHREAMTRAPAVVTRQRHYYHARTRSASFDHEMDDNDSSEWNENDLNDNNDPPQLDQENDETLGQQQQHSPMIRLHLPPTPPRQRLRAAAARSGDVDAVVVEATGKGSFPVSDVTTQLQRIVTCLKNLDNLFIPSTVNNFFNQRHVLATEREIITIFLECDGPELNWLIAHVQLGLLIYKIKDHRVLKNRTTLIQLLAVDRLSLLTVVSRVILLHSLQLLKLRAHPSAEEWVANILCHTSALGLSTLKTLTDAKGDYFCMHKLLFDDIRTPAIRRRILDHFQREARVVAQWREQDEAVVAAGGGRKLPITTQQFRKVLSDVDDTLTCSGGSYPAGIDKKYPKKAVYPGVLAFYRELDLGTRGPPEWQDDRVGNLVFLSARPHVYKDVSERVNFAKFEKLRARGIDGRLGMHTVPSLLAGDLASGSSYIVNNDFSPLAFKKFENFRNYASIYPEYHHVFVCDNGQGDVKAGELMHDAFPQEMEAVYVHVVKDVRRSYGYDPEKWREKRFAPCFFQTYPEAALHAAKQQSPLIRVDGLRRVCCDAVQDFVLMKDWPANSSMKERRREELNQAIYRANEYLVACGRKPAPLIPADRVWQNGERVRTSYGIGTIRDFNASFDLYAVDLDWRPLDEQIKDHISAKAINTHMSSHETRSLSVVTETGHEDESDVSLDEKVESNSRHLILSTPTRTLDRTKSRQLDTENVCTASRDPLRTSSDGALNPLIPCATPGKGNPEKLERKPSIQVHCSISGKYIHKYSPPILSKGDRKSGASIFTFLEPGKQQPTFKLDDKCNTPFGPGKIIEVRAKAGFVVVEMHGWHARSYLRQDLVKPISKGLFQSLFGPFSAGEGESSKSKEFPYIVGTQITTPFGRGTVCRPLPEPLPSKTPLRRPSGHRVPTMGISIESWTLADGTHPIVYCSLDSARSWKESKPAQLQAPKSSMLSSLFGQFSSVEAATPKRALVPLTEFPFVKGTPMTTPFGRGTVHQPIPTVFSNRMMEKRNASTLTAPATLGIAIETWALADGSHPMVFCTVETARAWMEPTQKSKPSMDILSSIFHFGGNDRVSTKVIGASSAKATSIPDNHYAKGTLISTPFGDGTIQRPCRFIPSTKTTSIRHEEIEISTIAISLDTWTLANGSHPLLYCTAASARAWKEHKLVNPGSMFSAFNLGSLMNNSLLNTSRTLLEPFLAPPKIDPKPEPPKLPVPSLVERFFSDGALVQTSYGLAEVIGFRADDGIYEVLLCNWILANGSHARAFIRKEGLQIHTASGCQVGSPVLIHLGGLTGTLASVDPKTGVHVVTIASAGMVCYLRPQCIFRPLKAMVGTMVSVPPYGEGTVIRYNVKYDSFEVKLKGWMSTVFTTASAISLVEHSKCDPCTPTIPVNWLMQYFFYSTSPAAVNKPPFTGGSAMTPRTARSRSSSFASIRSGS